MKRLLVVVSILAMASFAHADLVLSVNGNPAPDEIWLTTSEIITLGVMIPDGSSLLGVQAAIELSNAQAELLGGEYYFGDWIFPFYTISSSSGHVEFTGGTYGVEIQGPFTIMDGLLFHCLEATDVIITLHVTGETVQGGVSVPISTVLDSIIVHQVPEPMTVALLGLGGLLLLRRRSK